MLYLDRKPGEAIHIGNDIKIVVLYASANAVRIGINAPDNVKILREEIVNRKKRRGRS
jgi:carbon storage regulator